MAKHSHWDNIKHKKAANDKKKAAIIAKMGKLITVAVQQGGPSPDDNPRLRLAVDKSRSAGVGAEVIERAIKKAAGEGRDGKAMIEITYEGYAPGGVAVVVQALTDNRTRTAPEIKKLFERAGGSLGIPGCVAWQFKPKALFLVGDGAAAQGEEAVMEALLAAGIEPDDLAQEGSQVSVVAEAVRFDAVARALAAAGIAVASADRALVPETQVPVADETVAALAALVDSLEEHDDVQEVVHNGALPA
jgi:YebC/PmpR family DNA-binding regulatory protein